jgi:hypothetical protein
MATEEKIRHAIREIACRKRNVTLDDIEWVMNQLKAFADVNVRENDHQRMYSFQGSRFGVCTHHPGSRQVNVAYVKGFLAAMADTGWFED